MAEGESGGSWWGGWIETAKAKSVSAVEFLRKDLEEFTNVMKDDTSKAAEDVKKQLTQENATAATQKVKEGVNKVLGGITKALVIETEDKGAGKRGRKTSGEPIFDRAKARLRAIQLDPGTYCDDAEGSLEDYAKWLETFVLDSKKGDISELLVANVEVRSLYTQLVPSEVSHADFWQRYFFRLHQLDQDEARKAALMKRADVAQEEFDLEWEDADWGDIEGPSSPPKAATGTLHAGAAEAKQERKTQDSGQTHDVLDVSGSPSSESPSLRLESSDSESPETHAAANKTSDVQGDKQQTSLPEVKVSEAQKLDTVQEPVAVASREDNNTAHYDEKTTVDIVTIKKPAESKDVPVGAAAPPQDSVPENSGPVSAVSEPVVSVEPKEIGAVGAVDASSVMKLITVETELKTRDKGDMVVVGSERTTPSSDSTTNKESTSLDDDWERDFDDADLEVTEEDMRLAAEAAKKLAESGAVPDELEDDWENWD